jgi:diguanylate cyclase (GGDEF)-like protein
MVAFAAAPGPPGPFEALALESWSNIANLAVERRGFFEQLCYRARHDNLTGLFNRASFSERLEAELAQTAQQDGGLAVIFLDLDGFKNINDLYGHDAGDAVLREISRRLRESVRRTDTAARLGGDEFAVLLPGVDNREEAARIGKLIEDAVQIPVLFGDFELETGGSLGVALYPDDGMEPETLLKSADEDMYRKKSSHHARRQDHRAYA